MNKPQLFIDIRIYQIYTTYTPYIYEVIMTTNKDKLFTAKVEENLLSAFKHACENQDTTASQAVRAFMREYVRKYGQADLFSTPKKSK